MTTPVPALPDTARETTYAVSAGVGPYNVGFDLYMDGEDYENWIEVRLGDVVLDRGVDYTLASPSGPLAILPRPIRDARVSLTSARTGTLAIIGMSRPRRLVQLKENQGVPAHDFNLLFTHILATMRELWDRIDRGDVSGGPGAPGPPGSVSAAGDGTELLPGIAFASEGSSGLRRAGAGDLRIALLGTDRLKLSAGLLEYVGNLKAIDFTMRDLDLTGSLLASEASPPQIALDENDYALVPNKIVHRLTSSGNRSISGLVAAGRRLVWLLNANATAGSTITLVEESTSSAIANRFLMSGQGSITLKPGEAVPVWYDPTSSRWRVIATLSVATISEYLRGAPGKIVTSDVYWAARDPLTVGSVGGSLTLDLASRLNFRMTTSEDFTVQHPTNMKAGMDGLVRILQGGTPRKITFASGWDFFNGATQQLTQTAGASDDLYYTVVDAVTPIISGSLVKKVGP